MDKRFFTLIRIAFVVILSFILFLMVFFQNADYAAKKQFLISNFALIVLLGIVFFVCVLHYSRGNAHVLCSKPLSYDRLVVLCTAVLFIYQVFAFCSIFFLTSWDAGGIRNAAQYYALGQFVLGAQQYIFSTYPNNLLLSYIGAVVLRLNSYVGHFNGMYSTILLVPFNCLINSATCYLVYKASGLLVEKKFAFIAFLLAMLSFGISPWSIIFYSDSVGLIFPILVFFFFALPVQRKGLRYFCRFFAVFIAAASYYIKPQCIIVLIAVVIVEGLATLKDFHFIHFKKYLCLLVSCVICVGTVSLSLNTVTSVVGIQIDPNRTFGVAHFFMMGANEEGRGVYSHEDVLFSDSFATREERDKANIEVGLERIRRMGFPGYVKHICRKLLTTFNDGTFAWNREGNFYAELSDKPDNVITSALKSFYYQSGSRHDMFHIFAQIVWLVILICSLFSAFFRSTSAVQKSSCVLWVAVIGFVFFEILFEVRARYVYTFIPIFCVLSSMGISAISTLYIKKLKKRTISDDEN